MTRFNRLASWFWGHFSRHNQISSSMDKDSLDQRKLQSTNYRDKKIYIHIIVIFWVNFLTPKLSEVAKTYLLQLPINSTEKGLIFLHIIFHLKTVLLQTVWRVLPIRSGILIQYLLPRTHLLRHVLRILFNNFFLIFKEPDIIGLYYTLAILENWGLFYNFIDDEPATF